MADIVTQADLYVIFGDDEYLVGVVTDANGNTVDLTQSGVEITFKVSATNGGSALITKTISGGTIMADAAGNYTIKIFDTDKSSVAIDTSYVYSVRLTEPNTDFVTIARGNMRFVGTAAG